MAAFGVCRGSELICNPGNQGKTGKNPNRAYPSGSQPVRMSDVAIHSFAIQQRTMTYDLGPFRRIDVDLGSTSHQAANRLTFGRPCCLTCHRSY